MSRRARTWPTLAISAIRGSGYRCEELIAKIREILGTNREWPVVLGGLETWDVPWDTEDSETGLSGRGGFRHRYRENTCPIEGVPVYGIDALEEVVRGGGIRLAIIAVPGHAAQGVADKLVAAGVVGVLNFAPVTHQPADGSEYDRRRLGDGTGTTHFCRGQPSRLPEPRGSLE